MNKSYNNVIIDMSNLYHKAYAVGKRRTHTLQDGVKVSSGAVSEALAHLHRIESNFTDGSSRIFCVFEGGPSSRSDRVVNRRSEIDPEYKSAREHKDVVFYRGIELLELIVMNMSDKFVIVHVPGYEADDVVKPLLADLDAENDYTLLISEDMDWTRSLSETVHVLRQGRILDRDDFEEEFGFVPSENSVALYKAFRGDASDGIQKGVPGIREKTLLHIVNSYDSLNDLFRNYEDDPVLGETWVNRIRENKPRLRLNYKLVSYLPLTRDEVLEHTFVCEFNQKSLVKLSQSIGIDKVSDSTEKSGFFSSLR